MTEGTLALTAEEPTGSSYVQNADMNTHNPLTQTEINNGRSSIANHTVSVRFLFNNR